MQSQIAQYINSCFSDCDKKSIFELRVLFSAALTFRIDCQDMENEDYDFVMKQVSNLVDKHDSTWLHAE